MEIGDKAQLTLHYGMSPVTFAQHHCSHHCLITLRARQPVQSIISTLSRRSLQFQPSPLSSSHFDFNADLLTEVAALLPRKPGLAPRTL